jgi:hypothetical protein
MGWIWRVAVRHNHFRTPPDRCAGPLMATLSEPVIAQTELDAVELGIASPARIGFNAQRVTSIQKTFLVLDSTWRTTFLSRTSSITIQANPPSGVVSGGGIAAGVNDNNILVGYNVHPNFNYGLAYQISTKTLVTFRFPGAAWTFGFGINNASQIVGYYQDNGGTQHGFLRTP